MTVSFVAAGTAATGADVASLAPALPVGLVEEDVVIVLAAASQGVAITTPTGYAAFKASVNSGGSALGLFWKKWASGDTAPTVAFGANATKNCAAQCAGFRGLDSETLLDQISATSNGSSTQDIGPVAGVTPTKAKSLVITIGTRRNNPTSIATLSGDSLTWNEIGELKSSAGGISLGAVWDYAVDPATTAVSSKSFTVTGGSTANWLGFTCNLRAEPRPMKFKATGTFTTRSVKFKASGAFGQVERRYAASGVLSLLKSDLGNNVDPLPKWGQLDAAATSRYEIISTGGDTRTRPDGVAQGNTSHMRISVHDGDDVVGERAEIGYNSWKNPIGFYVFEQGMERTVWESIRLPADYPLANINWQVVTQFKPCGPASLLHNSPPIALEARNGNWNIIGFGATTPLWSTPASVSTWWQFKWTMRFSQFSDGFVELTANDGSTDYTSGRINCATLDTNVGEVTYGSEGVVIHDGDPIPGTIRCGVYHNPVVPGTSIDLDNVHVGTYATVWKEG